MSERVPIVLELNIKNRYQKCFPADSKFIHFITVFVCIYFVFVSVVLGIVDSQECWCRRSGMLSGWRSRACFCSNAGFQLNTHILSHSLSTSMPSPTVPLYQVVCSSGLGSGPNPDVWPARRCVTLCWKYINDLVRAANKKPKVTNL